MRKKLNKKYEFLTGEQNESKELKIIEEKFRSLENIKFIKTKDLFEVDEEIDFELYRTIWNKLIFHVFKYTKYNTSLDNKFIIFCNKNFIDLLQTKKLNLTYDTEEYILNLRNLDFEETKNLFYFLDGEFLNDKFNKTNKCIFHRFYDYKFKIFKYFKEKDVEFRNGKFYSRFHGHSYENKSFTLNHDELKQLKRKLKINQIFS